MHPRLISIPTNGIQLRGVILGSGPLVLLVHGFPEGWHSWRHQLQPIADAGFTACAVDVRGYGGSDKPAAAADYALAQITADIAGAAAHLQPEAPAILIGHDWGAPIVWNTALAYPQQVSAVAGLSIPWTGIAKEPFLVPIHAAFTARGRFFYQVYFQDEGVAEAELQADVRATLRKFIYALSGDAPDGTWPKNKPHGAKLLDGLPDPQPFPAWWTQADEDHAVAEFQRSGFLGPLHRYRNDTRDFEWQQQFRGRQISQPSLFIGGERDLALRMLPGVRPEDLMAPHLPGLRGVHMLPGIGHWTQQEAPAQVNALLLDWLRGL